MSVIVYTRESRISTNPPRRGLNSWEGCIWTLTQTWSLQFHVRATGNVLQTIEAKKGSMKTKPHEYIPNIISSLEGLLYEFS